MRLSIATLIFVFSLPLLPQSAGAAPKVMKRVKQTYQQNKGKINTVARRTTRGVLLAGGALLTGWGATKGVSPEALVAMGWGANLAVTGAMAPKRNFLRTVAASIGTGAVVNGVLSGLTGFYVGDLGGGVKAASFAGILTKGIVTTASASTTGLVLPRK